MSARLRPTDERADRLRVFADVSVQYLEDAKREGKDMVREFFRVSLALLVMQDRYDLNKRDVCMRIFMMGVQLFGSEPDNPRVAEALHTLSRALSPPPRTDTLH